MHCSVKRFNGCDDQLQKPQLHLSSIAFRSQKSSPTEDFPWKPLKSSSTSSLCLPLQLHSPRWDTSYRLPNELQLIQKAAKPVDCRSVYMRLIYVNGNAVQRNECQMHIYVRYRIDYNSKWLTVYHETIAYVWGIMNKNIIEWLRCGRLSSANILCPSPSYRHSLQWPDRQFMSGKIAKCDQRCMNGIALGLFW